MGRAFHRPLAPTWYSTQPRDHMSMDWLLRGGLVAPAAALCLELPALVAM
jgi:hypothetical protein